MTLFTSLPRHVYCHVERRFVMAPLVQDDGDEPELLPCAWFGLTSVPGRAWGLTALLESGAVYSHIPPHAIVFGDGPAVPWTIRQAQLWDCFGYEFALHEYAYLAGRTIGASIEKRRGELMQGRYLFTAQHYGDAYSMTPEQAKQYHFLELHNGRLTCLPANRFVVDAAEFTDITGGLPKGLLRQREEYSVE